MSNTKLKGLYAVLGKGGIIVDSPVEEIACLKTTIIRPQTVARLKNGKVVQVPKYD